MKLQSPFRREKEKALTASSTVSQAINAGWSGLPRLGVDGAARDRITNVWTHAKSASYAWIYANSPAVRTVVDVIVRNVGQLDLDLYELERDEGEGEALTPRPDHPAAQSMLYPTETQTGDSLVRALLKDFLLYDDAYAILAPGPGFRLIIQWVPAHMVEPRGSSLFAADYYRVWATDGTFTEIDAVNVLHWHGENPLDPRVGLSRLDTLRPVIAEDAALQQATVELANSGLASPSWVFRPEEAPEWSPEAANAFAEDLANRIRRRNKVPVVLEEGMELRDFGVSPRDAQMFEVRRWAIERVATEYGVPLGMVGLADDVKSAQSIFYSDVLPPYCQDMCRALDLRILVKAYGWTDGRFAFNLDEKLMGDERIKTLVSATGRAVLLTNEARAMLGKPAVKGGDELVTPLNVVAGDNPKPSVDVNPPGDPNAPAGDGSGREGDGPQPPGTGTPNQASDDWPPDPWPALLRANGTKSLHVHVDSVDSTAEEIPERPALTGKASAPLPQLHPGRKAELGRQQDNVEKMVSLMQRYSDRFARSLTEAGQKADGAQPPEPNWKRWNRELTRDLQDAITGMVSAEGSIYALKLAHTHFDMDLVRNYIRAMAQGAATGINDSIKEAWDEGGSDAAIGRANQAVATAGAGLGARATIWARQEATRQAPGTSGRVQTWVADTERHAEFDGDTVAFGEDWPAGFAPGTAPGCQCTAVIT